MAICDHGTWRRWLYLEYLIVCIVGSLSQRHCTNNGVFIETSSYFLEEDTEVYPVQYGDCSFGESLCNYTQFCTDRDAEDWRQTGACSFEDENTPSTCGWTLDNWSITLLLIPENVSGATSTGYFVYIIHQTTKATLTSTLVQSTGSQTGCLEFSYFICGPELRLLVSIQSLDGDRRAVWVVSSNTSTVDCLQTWQQAAVPLSSAAAFTVMFENVPTDKCSGVVAVDSVRYTTQPSSSACPLAPQNALPRDDDVISTLPTSSTPRLSGSISPVSVSVGYKPATTTTFLQSTSSWLGDVTAVSSVTSFPQEMSENSNSDQTTPIIAGVVSAVVIVIACIVAVVIIVIRKRRQNLEGAKIISDDTNGNANDVHYASEHPVVETILEDREDRAVIADPENDPYDVAEDGVPGITRSALSGNRGYILSPVDTARSSSISQKSPKQRKGAPGMHSAAHNQQKGEPEVYSQVRKEKKEAQDVYSLFHKQRKEEINKSSGHGSTAGSLLNPSYTPEIYELANPQPTQAMADTPDDQEYNALNFDIDRQVGESTHPREATGQTYDHLHGDVLYDCAKVEHNPHGVNMVIDAEYNHLV